MLNSVRIYGAWDEGIVLDNHMLKSIFLGYDEKLKEIAIKWCEENNLEYEE